MSFFMMLVVAILIAVSTFGLNQIMMMHQDVKLIKSMISAVPGGNKTETDAEKDKNSPNKETAKDKETEK